MYRHRAEYRIAPKRCVAVTAVSNHHTARSVFFGVFLLMAAFALGLGGCAGVPQVGGAAVAGVAVNLAEQDYVGSDNCAECHEEIHDKWEKTLHARMMQDPNENPDAVLGDLEQKLPFKAEDIKYTLGNHWTQRYLTEIDDEYYVLPRMWSIQQREWMPYSIFSWKRKPWRVFCAGCHTTGYDHESETFVETSIGCEACHGPGSAHAEDPSLQGSIVNPSKLSKERALMVCEACHVKGRDNGNPDYVFPLDHLPGDDLAETYTPLDLEEGEDVALALHRIYDEWKEKLSQPEGASCDLCQDFRAPPEQSADQSAPAPKASTLICHSCHDTAEEKSSHSNHPPEVVCTDCHVPNFSKSGESQDIHSHRFQFKTPSKYLAYEECYEIKMEETCGSCHSGTTTNWAIKEISKWDTRPFKKLHKVSD